MSVVGSRHPTKNIDESEKNLANVVGNLRDQQLCARKTQTLLRHPFETLYYFSIILKDRAIWSINQLRQHRKKTGLIVLLICSFFTGVYTTWTYQSHFQRVWTVLRISTWWIFLGFLSSFGVGAGLHTFVLYLGPFIARTTLAATECQSMLFDRYGPDAFTCTTRGAEVPSFFSIWNAVIFEAFSWGLGTAIGELPPYFIARASRLAQDRLKEVSDTTESPHVPSATGDSLKPPADYCLPELCHRLTETFSSYWHACLRLCARLRHCVVAWLGKIGFWGILLFASVPNPFFDLAGLTCGHMLFPFKTFFLATFIGKAMIKMSLQTIFVIMIFNMNRLDALIQFVDQNVPFAAGRIRDSFDQLRAQYYQPLSPDEGAFEPSHALSSRRFKLAWSVFIWFMIVYFLATTINSMVQEYLTRQDESRLQLLKTNLDNKRRSDEKKA